MLQYLNKIKTFIKCCINYTLSAPFCFYCKNYLHEYTALCKSCLNLIKPIISAKIYINNSEITIFAISDYKEPLKSLILAKNYSNRSSAILLAQLIFKKTLINNFEFDYLIPVPLHFTRECLRGYNQAEIIARELAFLTKKPMLNCITRVKKTKLQSMLSALEREQNVRDVFKITNLDVNIENKIIILVDDLMTTGSTIKNCAKVLLNFKPKKIYVIVACRVCS